jgi:hypothetical protein
VCQLFKARGERSSFVLALEELKEAEQNGYLRYFHANCIRPFSLEFSVCLLSTATQRFFPSPQQSLAA